MTTPATRVTVLTLLQGDAELYELLRREGLLPVDEAAIGPEQLEVARVAHTLLRELEVNLAGVEIVLRMRAELIASRRQVAELLSFLESRRSESDPAAPREPR